MQKLILSYCFQRRIIILSFFLLTLVLNDSLANNYEPKVAINGSGLKIPRMVSLNQSLVFMRSGPGLNYPIKFELRKKKYPMKIISEYYNWRQVVTYNNIKGWIATHLLSSVKTGLILKTTFLKISPSNQSLSKAKLLPQLLIEIKKCNNNIKLHLIGRLQTNKVKFALTIFDYIHSLDSEKLAAKIADEQEIQGKKPKIFIQVNIGNEDQKSGIHKDKLVNFYEFCKDLNLDIVGTMCIPPNDGYTEKYFSEMSDINKELNFQELSMGMSGDYLEAIRYNATYVRLGSKIFGIRD